PAVRQSSLFGAARTPPQQADTAAQIGGDVRTLQVMICGVLSQMPGTAARGSALGTGHCVLGGVLSRRFRRGQYGRWMIQGLRAVTSHHIPFSTTRPAPAYGTGASGTASSAGGILSGGASAMRRRAMSVDPKKATASSISEPVRIGRAIDSSETSWNRADARRCATRSASANAN